MKVSVFIAATVDGYIASLDDSLDWLAMDPVPGEETGYESFFSTIDCLVMGANTFKKSFDI